MKVIVLEDNLMDYLQFVVQSHMSQAPMEELPPLMGLYRAITSAQDIPVPQAAPEQEVVQLEGPITVEINAEELAGKGEIDG